MAMAAQTTAPSFRKILMESSIAWAERMITKWDPRTSRSPYANVASIFYQSRDEARRFLFAVHDLQQAIHRFDDNNSNGSLVRAQLLLETAMNRLQKEFAEILSSNRDTCPNSQAGNTSFTFRSYLTEYGSDGEESFPTAAVDYLRAIAECMIQSGYVQECVDIYKRSRRSVVEDSLSRLGFEHMSSSDVQKLNWESLDFRINRWLAASRAVVGEIFEGERVLCEYIFSTSESIRDSCFAEITIDAAVQFFRFPHVMASKNRRPQEKTFHYFNMYRSISELSPEIESMFSSKATNMIQSQVTTSLQKLASTIRSMLADFESAILKDTSKSSPPGCGLHVLTQTATSHLVLLADYGDILAELFVDDPLPSWMAIVPEQVIHTKRLQPIDEEAPENIGSSVAARFVWLVTVLLCKLDVKAELYKEPSQSYLFLTNNLQYVVNKVRESKLAQLLGHDWISSHEKKARSFARSFLRLAWNRVLEAVPADPSALMEVGGVESGREMMAEFNKAFEEACRSQVCLVVLDEKIRDEIKSAIARNVVGPYRALYERCREELRAAEGAAAVVRFAPEDLGNRLSGLYWENSGSFDCESSSSGSSGSGSGSCKGGRWRWLREPR